MHTRMHSSQTALDPWDTIADLSPEKVAELGRAWLGTRHWMKKGKVAMADAASLRELAQLSIDVAPRLA